MDSEQGLEAILKTDQSDRVETDLNHLKQHEQMKL